MNLVASAQKFPDHTALQMDYQVLTYARLDDTTARLARLMAAMLIRPGDRIGLMVPNVPEFGLVFYAALRCGAVVVPMNPLLTEREIAYYLQDSGARFLFAWHEIPDVALVGRPRPRGPSGSWRERRRCRRHWQHGDLLAG